MLLPPGCQEAWSILLGKSPLGGPERKENGMGHPVVWFEVIGKNGGNLRAFYGELFDWSFEIDDKINYGMVEAVEGQGIPGGVGAGDERRVTFYVSTPSINACLEQVSARGGRILMKRTELPGGTVLGMFADPEGNAVGLVEEAA